MIDNNDSNYNYGNNNNFREPININNLNNINYYSRSLDIPNNQSLIINLQKIWTNEKFAKDLLKYEDDFLTEVKAVLEKKEIELNILLNTNNTQSKEDAEILELDLERIKFLLKDYLRIRLSKIDKYLYYIVKDDLNELLSKSEFDFAFDLFKMKKNYFHEGLNKKIPDQFNDFKPYPLNNDMIVTPPWNSFVCFKSCTYEPISISMKDILEESDETVIINREDVYCLPLSLIK